MIVLGTDGPDHSVHGSHKIPGGGADLAHGGVGLIVFSRWSLAKKGDARETGAEVIVNVAGDAAAFLFEGLLGGERLKLGLVFPAEPQIDKPTCDESGQDGDPKFEPPGFPKEGFHGDVDGGSTLAPFSGAVVGNDFESIVAGGEAGEGDTTLLVDDLPFFINGMEPIADESVFGSSKV